MKLVLLQPPVQDFYDTDIRLQPLGLGYLKAVVRQHLPHVDVIVKDYHQGWGRRTLPVPPELDYLKEFYPWPDQSPFSSFFHYYHFGAPFEKIAEEVAAQRPDLVGISSLFSPYYREVLKCAETIKKRFQVPILLGGSHVSAAAEAMLKNPYVDFVIRGEGERPLVEFLKSWQNGRRFEEVPNLGFKKQGRLIFNGMQDNYALEELPVPDLTDLEAGRYRFGKERLTFLVTSRSCPHRCSFCSVHQTFGFRYRSRRPDQVLEEIRQRYEEGIRVFDFEDDNLTYYKPEMKQLCRRLIAAFPKRDVRFVAMNGISYLSLDEELLNLMKEAGFTHLNLSLVSSDVTVRETTKRPHTIEKYLEVVHAAFQRGFKIVSYQIFGLPAESLDSMIQTLSFAARLPVLLGASMFYLTPNSPIAKPFGAPDEEDIFKARLTAMAIETGHFKREDIYTLFVTTRILNFLKGISFEGPQLTLGEALRRAEGQAGRSQIGSELLKRLLVEKKLYAWTSRGLAELPKFSTGLFLRIWEETGEVVTQEGKKIKLGLLPAGFAPSRPRPGRKFSPARAG